MKLVSRSTSRRVVIGRSTRGVAAVAALVALGALVAAPAANADDAGRLTGPLLSSTGDTWVGSAAEGALVPVSSVDQGTDWSLPQMYETGEVRVGDLCLTVSPYFGGSVSLVECMGVPEQEFVVIPGSRPSSFQVHSMLPLMWPMGPEDDSTIPISANASTAGMVTLQGATDFDLSAMNEAAAPVPSDWWGHWLGIEAAPTGDLR
ncbi:hypothetical protein [Microbacterium sp. NPDC055665]